MPPSPVDDTQRDTHPGSDQTLRGVLEHAARYLPAQGPISVFIHHNPLHAFEHLPFERAVVEAGALFGCEPYLSLDDYRSALARGRIRDADLEAVLREDLGDSANRSLGSFGTRREIRLAMLRRSARSAIGAELQWFLGETDALDRFRPDLDRDTRARLLATAPRGRERSAVRALWRACLGAAAYAPDEPRSLPVPVRHRDFVRLATGVDSDALVHPLLIRVCAAFLDQGVAYWSMPDRSLGLYRAFLHIYGQTGGSPEPWLRALQAALATEATEARSGLASLERSLSDLGVREPECEPFIVQTLLALRGWAGMIWQFDTRPDRAPVHAPPTSLADFLAVYLLIERAALAYVAANAGWRGDLSRLREAFHARLPAPAPDSIEERAYRLFQVAQLLGRGAADVARLSPDDAARVVHEIRSLTRVERRRLFQLAYERRHRIEALAGLSHANPATASLSPSWQVVCCIDEREESLRRHIEEADPSCETFGTAGFFGVAMYYRGVDDARPAPLCPIALRPEHEVEEIAVERQGEAARLRSRRVLGALAHRVSVGSRSLTRGTLLMALLGTIASIPLVWRVLFPRLTARLRRLSGRLVRAPAVTRLALERRDDARTALGRYAGFTLEEMATVVAREIEGMGLAGKIAPLVLVMGHGSSSLNNPHESAHDCGACGGGRGGPNARAFASMANTPAVRSLLAARGLTLPEGTWFVGAMHNSCDDAVVLYDLDCVPAVFSAQVQSVQTTLTAARANNAHERCRRFENAPTWLPPALALAHVEARSEDLAQPRPEYGHATNALAIVGRRVRTRGLFLDRRAFLVSYDPTRDDAVGTVLARHLSAVIPVIAGINLEYYFSFVDPHGYGCATKLPHNVTGLLGVMDGHQSDLRAGLPWQMVEIHEPLRLLCVVETVPAVLTGVIERNPALARLVNNRWMQLATLDPDSATIHTRGSQGFTPYVPESLDLPEAARSIDWYGGRRDHLGCARIRGIP